MSEYHNCPKHGKEECMADIDADEPWYVKAAYPHSCQTFANSYYGNFSKKGRLMTTRQALRAIKPK